VDVLDLRVQVADVSAAASFAGAARLPETAGYVTTSGQWTVPWRQWTGWAAAVSDFVGVPVLVTVVAPEPVVAVA
jgi:hypothetical protein